MFVQWTTQQLNPRGRSPSRGQVSHRAILVKSEWVGGKVRKINRHLATVRFKPDRAGAGAFLNTDRFLAICEKKLRKLRVNDSDRYKIMLNIQNHVADSPGPET